MANRFANATLIAITGIVLVLLYGPILIPILSSFFEVRQGNVDWLRTSEA